MAAQAPVLATRNRLSSCGLEPRCGGRRGLEKHEERIGAARRPLSHHDLVTVAADPEPYGAGTAAEAREGEPTCAIRTVSLDAEVASQGQSDRRAGNRNARRGADHPARVCRRIAGGEKQGGEEERRDDARHGAGREPPRNANVQLQGSS